jgi:inhibitor of cysteine peptidase
MHQRARAFLVMAFLACIACKESSAPPPNAAESSALAASAAPVPDATVVRADDDGKAFDVAVGSMVTFKLAGNQGTGFAWGITQIDPSVLAQQGERTSEAASDVPGASKMDVYRFTAQKAGTTVVQLSLQRAFGSAPPARVVSVTIHVHGS